MKKKLLIIFLGLIFIKCSTSQNHIVEPKGTYRGKNHEESITFNTPNSYIITPPSYKTFNDTLSYGTWKIDNNMIVLNSSKKISNNFMEIEVNETFSGSEDSTYVIIENPEIGFTDYQDNLIPYVYYKFNSIKDNEEHFESKIFSKKITFKNKGGIDNFYISIFPNLDIYPSKISVNSLKTKEYKPQNKRNNTFIIKIRNFDYKYFSFKRFNEEYIKIINNDTLLWDNEIFIKRLK